MMDVTRLAEVFDGIRDSEKSDRLSSWEIDFLESIEKQWKRKGSLSDKQLERLEEIWEKV